MRVRLFFSCLLLIATNAFSQVTFTTDTLTASGPTITGDFNRDGHPDIAILNSNGDGYLYVYFGVGGGNFNLAYVDKTVPTGITEMHTADLNNNGVLDLILSSAQSNVAHILWGSSTGNFTTGPTVTFAKDIQQLMLGDVNNDGKVDLVANECASPYTLPCQTETKLNKGSGTFATSQSLSLTEVPLQSDLTDINRDGKLDLITAFNQSLTSSGLVQIYRGSGTGTFSALSHITTPVVCTTPTSPGSCYDSLSGFAVADFYNDTNLHLVVLQNHELPGGDGTGTASLYTYKNNGAGTFALTHTTSLSTAETNILAADLNVDQKQDLLVDNGAVRSTNAYYLLGNGNGTFNAQVAAPWNVADGGLDFTRDLALTSRPDVVSTQGAYAGSLTMININTTNASNCPPPGSGKLAAKICSPAAGSTTSSTSVTVRGSGNSPAGVQRLEIWIDGTKRGLRWADQIKETFTLSAGTHRVTVVAVDLYEGTASTSESITVP